MITSAAVKLKLKGGREIIMPVHRHGDAYQIMRDLGFRPEDYATVSQGFLYAEVDPEDELHWIYGYLNRREALTHAVKCRQVINSMSKDELYSEDLW